MSAARGSDGAGEARPWWQLSLSAQIVVGLIVGIVGGYLVNLHYGQLDFPDNTARDAFLAWPGLLRDIFRFGRLDKPK